MKTLSILLTFALFLAVNALATHLRHSNALPANSTPQKTVAAVRPHAFENVQHD